MKAIFLDIDGVLNAHVPYENGYCGIDHPLWINLILRSVPDAQVVLSSSWRYAVHNGLCTVAGLEHLLLTHGVCIKGRLHGVTDPDPETFDPTHHEPPFDREYWERRGMEWRAKQIYDYIARHEVRVWVVLDDLNLAVTNLVRPDPNVGMTRSSAVKAIEILRGRIK